MSSIIDAEMNTKPVVDTTLPFREIFMDESHILRTIYSHVTTLLKFRCVLKLKATFNIVLPYPPNKNDAFSSVVPLTTHNILE